MHGHSPLVARTKRAFASRLPALITAVGLSSGAGAAGMDVDSLVSKLDSAHAGIQDYQMRVVSTVRHGDRPPEETRLLYSFQRPDRFRIEFLEPHPGLVLVYPSDSGKVRMQPGGLFRFFSISLDAGSASLEVSPGQRIDQSDLGLLVRNIARSLAEPPPGGASLRFTPDIVVVEVEAENHFQPGVHTRYEYWIDRQLWLPVRVREEVPSQEWAREVSFEDLQTNLGLPDALFQLE